MRLSETIWKLNLVENVRDKLSKIQNAADKTALRMSNIQDKMGGMGKAGKGALGQIEAALPSVGGGITQYMTNPWLAAGAALAAIVVGSVQMGARFDEGMAKVNATAQLSKKELNEIGKKLLDLGRHGGGAYVEQLPNAFEKVLSQVNDVDKSMEIVEASVMGAKAGFTDINVVAGAVAQSVSAIGGDVDAMAVQDTLFSAKRFGAGELDDFANHLPGLIAQGKNLGMQYQDVAGIFSYMTAKGQSAAESSMLLQNAISVLGRGEVQKGLEKIGVKIFDEKGAVRGFDAIFSDLSVRTRTLNDKQKTQLFENIGLMDMQAKQAFSLLMNDTEKLKGIMGEVRNSAGETQRAYEATDNAARTLADATGAFKADMIALGTEILPPLMALLRGLGNILLWSYRIAIKPIVEAFKWVNDMLMKVSKWLAKAMGIEIKEEVAKPAKAGDPDAAKKAGPSTDAKTPPGLTQAELDRLKSDKQKKGMDAIHGGGTQTRNITVTVNKIVEGGITINSTSVKEGLHDMERMVQEALVRIINGAEMAVANG